MPSLAKLRIQILLALAIVANVSSAAAPALMNKHCAKCHSDKKAEGEFKLSEMGDHPTDANLQRWLDSLDRVSAEEMPPPEDDVVLTKTERQALIALLKQELSRFDAAAAKGRKTKTRRMNNREFENSVRDALLLEDIGTNLPTDNLIGDSLHHGFDTHGETLGFSKFHLEQYIVAVRIIVDATIFSGEQPPSRRYEVGGEKIVAGSTSQNTQRRERTGTEEGFNFLDPKSLAYFKNFTTVPTTGRYKITIRCQGMDRGVYDAKKTGIHDGDPIRLIVRLGGRERAFDLPDQDVMSIELDEWLANGTRLQLQNPTDGLRLRGNGNFKFQYAIGGEYMKENEPDTYGKVVAAIKPRRPGGRVRGPASWHHWVDYWQGPRPRIFDAEIEGPLYDSWPPKRQVALLGANPKADDPAAIMSVLQPIANRAWRRPVAAEELDSIVKLVQSKSKQLGDIEAIKEGIVAVLVSPQFLLLNSDDDKPAERFASKLSYFLQSTLPDDDLRKTVAAAKLNSFEEVRAAVQRQFGDSKADAFLRAFPYAWLELNDINFMAPDPDRYRHYHRKAISEDMIAEALHFFRHAIEENVPLPEFLSADYSFINADLATVYGVKDVESDSTFRQYTFADGRRGGLLGMGAFLTTTADSLSTSPIHRAVYVMENFMGIHPTPPPPDIEITEPDVRQARTIKEILKTHRSDANCASCHQTIDPYGYAFENFDPAGAWRNVYPAPKIASNKKDAAKKRNRRANARSGIPVDASATFRNGTQYQDIVEYRKHLLTEVNRDRFVRCFITKLLTYANGAEPEKADFAAIDKIVAKSAEHDYRVVDTIAAVIHSPLFRE